MFLRQVLLICTLSFAGQVYSYEFDMEVYTNFEKGSQLSTDIRKLLDDEYVPESEKVC